jgi:predicted enzyme related to lactoylglutathione lyase
LEKVTGIGGFFFRAKDPKALGRWYQQHLGVSLILSSEGDPVWEQEAGPTAFAPFPETSKYFGDAQKVWMLNFRVRDLDKMAAQLQAAGIEIKMYPPDPTGRFARVHDPEGNPIELWQPKAPDTKGLGCKAVQDCSWISLCCGRCESNGIPSGRRYGSCDESFRVQRA